MSTKNKKDEKADKPTGYVQKDKRPLKSRVPGKETGRGTEEIKDRINSEEPENPTDNV